MPRQIIRAAYPLVMDHKADGAEAKGCITGYAAVYGNVDSYDDVILPGAFTEALKSGRPPAMLWQHNDREPIGVWGSLVEDEKGLRCEGQLLVDDIPRAKEAYALLRAGAIKGLSIGYTAVDWQMTLVEDRRTRELRKVDLWEVSLVTFPANDAAGIESVKSSLEKIETVRDIEACLREAGMSRSEAKGLISKARTVFLRDAGDIAAEAEAKAAAMRLLDMISG